MLIVAGLISMNSFSKVVFGCGAVAGLVGLGTGDNGLGTTMGVKSIVWILRGREAP